MSGVLLRSKLFILPLRPNLVPRQNLIEQLNLGHQSGHKLTLICAPAGFGKTTLVSEWAADLQLAAASDSQTSYALAWLALDEGDNDPTRFLAYFIAAVNQVEGLETAVGEEALGMLQSSQPPPPEAILISLLNDITIISEKIVFVLDDYHLIDAQDVHNALTYLLEHLPPQLHLVIATRDDPNLPLARLRARGQLTELRAMDLRFSTNEAAEFLNQVMNLALSSEEIAALESRTEGWIAGLHLAAVSMQGRDDTQSFIKSFTGSHRFVLDYLIEEVLEQETTNVQNFLLQTAVLNRFSGPLCDALTGQDDSQATLELLERANLFIIPLDEERQWYRYHHLFSDLLKLRLRQKHPDQVPILHYVASVWYEHNGFIDEAIEHALRAADFARMTHLVEEHVDAVWQRGEHSKLRRWLGKLPGELIGGKPQLSIIYAWYLFAMGRQDEAEKTLQAAEKKLDPAANSQSETRPQTGSSLPDCSRRQLRGRAAAVRAFMASFRGDIAGIIQYAHEALEYLPEQDTAWRSITALALGDAQGFKGDMPAAYAARLQALQACQAAGSTYYILLASMKVAITLRSQGRLQETIEICRQQKQLANENGLSQTSLFGLILLVWSEVLVEINDLDQAINLAQKGADLSKRGKDQAMAGWGSMCLIRILFSTGDLTGVQEIIQQMEHKAQVTNVPPWIMRQTAAWQMRLWLEQDKLEAVSQWLVDRELERDAAANKPLLEIDYFALFDYILLARIQIVQGHLDEATKLLQQLLTAAESGGRTTRVIEIHILQALAYQRAGDLSQAMIPLKQAFTLAETEGFVRIFLDEGPPMAHLLYEAFSRGIHPDYTQRLLAHLSTDIKLQTNPTESQVPKTGLIDPLSEREIEILQLIAQGLSNREIAARLFLSLNTVKVHNRNIFSKLDAHTRTQAVARARSLGMLATI